MIATEKPSVVHIHSVSELAAPAQEIAKSLGIPVLLHVHGGIAPHDPQSYLRHIRKADTVLAVSRFAAQSAIAGSGRSAPVVVVANGVPDPLDIIGPADAALDVIIIGRLSEEKGVDLGLRALARVALRIPALKVGIIGGGNELPALMALRDELGLAGNVDFRGPVEHVETLRAIASARVLLIPSRHTEGFGLVAAEAAFLGVPVVAANAGGLPETVIDRVTGLIVDPENSSEVADAVCRLLESAPLRLELGRNARAHALKSFTMQRFARDVLSHYPQTSGGTE